MLTVLLGRGDPDGARPGDVAAITPHPNGLGLNGTGCPPNPGFAQHTDISSHDARLDPRSTHFGERSGLLPLPPGAAFPRWGGAAPRWGVLIYDAQCRLCCFSQKWIKRWDRKQTLQFASFDEVAACGRAPEMPDGITMMRFVDRHGTVSSGVAAFREMLRILPLGRIVALLFRFPGVVGTAHWVYRRIAKNRYRWFGKATSNRPTPPIPKRFAPEWRGRE